MLNALQVRTSQYANGADKFLCPEGPFLIFDFSRFLGVLFWFTRILLQKAFSQSMYQVRKNAFPCHPKFKMPPRYFLVVLSITMGSLIIHKDCPRERLPVPNTECLPLVLCVFLGFPQICFFFCVFSSS